MRRTLFFNVQVWDASREFVEEGMNIAQKKTEQILMAAGSI